MAFAGTIIVTDPRTVIDFQKFTFSGHLRQHVCKVLNENIKISHADYACYWALELVCSGLMHTLWQTMFDSASVHINRTTPNVFLYLVKKYEEYAEYEQSYDIYKMTDIRNNEAVRQLVCEVATTLAMCRKNKLQTLPKITPVHDFNPEIIKESLRSPSANYARPIVKPDDPLELYIPFNEFIYCLRPEVRDFTRALYWVAWMLKYVKENKNALVCHVRPNPAIEDKFCKHIIWMLWDGVISGVPNISGAGRQPYIDALFKLHCSRWAPVSMKSRVPFLISAIGILCESSLDTMYNLPSPTEIATHKNISQWIQAIIHTQKTFSS